MRVLTAGKKVGRHKKGQVNALAIVGERKRLKLYV